MALQQQQLQKQLLAQQQLMQQQVLAMILPPQSLCCDVLFLVDGRGDAPYMHNML